MLHAACALAALVIGGIQLIRRKGGAVHRWVGRSWAVLMLVIAASSFWIHGIDQWRSYSWIHLISIWTLISLPLAIWQARRGNFSAHRKWMIGLYAGGLVIAGVFTLLPGRVMHTVLFG